MGADVNPDVGGMQDGWLESAGWSPGGGGRGRSVDFDGPGHAVLDADPALGAQVGLDQLGPSVLVFEDVLGAHLLANAGALAQLEVDAYGHVTLSLRLV